MTKIIQLKIIKILQNNSIQSYNVIYAKIIVTKLYKKCYKCEKTRNTLRTLTSRQFGNSYIEKTMGNYSTYAKINW